MKIYVVIGHQQVGSYCHAIAATAMEELAAAGHDVIYHDLYEEQFDPVLPAAEVPTDATLEPAIQQHCDEVVEADGFIVVHPNWWGQPPAMLKGWVDRVLRQGVAYEFTAEGANGFFKEKPALVITTSNTPRDVELKVFGDPLENLWRNCIFGLCGVKKFQRRNFESIIMSTPEQRAEWLDEVRQLVRQSFPADN